MAEALGKLAAVREKFAQDYRAMLDDVTRARPSRSPSAPSTTRAFPTRQQRRIAAIGLSVFNDIITREAAARGLALIDLRLICTEDADLANPIEPSVIGGAKIANAIAAFAADYDVSQGPLRGVHRVRRQDLKYARERPLPDLLAACLCYLAREGATLWP